MRKWFQPEIDFLTRHWNDYTAKEIGSELDDPHRTITLECDLATAIIAPIRYMD